MKHVLVIAVAAIIILLITIIQLEILLLGGKVLYDEDSKSQRKKEYKSNLILGGGVYDLFHNVLLGKIYIQNHLTDMFGFRHTGVSLTKNSNTR